MSDEEDERVLYVHFQTRQDRAKFVHLLKDGVYNQRVQLRVAPSDSDARQNMMWIAVRYRETV